MYKPRGYAYLTWSAMVLRSTVRWGYSIPVASSWRALGRRSLRYVNSPSYSYRGLRSEPDTLRCSGAVEMLESSHSRGEETGVLVEGREDNLVD